MEENSGADPGRGGQGVDDPIFEKGGIKQISLIPLLLETNRKVYCNLFSSRTKLIFWSNQPILWGRKNFKFFKMCKYYFCVVSVCVHCAVSAYDGGGMYMMGGDV